MNTVKELAPYSILKTDRTDVKQRLSQSLSLVTESPYPRTGYARRA